MTNVLKQENVQYFEWNVRTPAECGKRVISESFLFQDCTCNLEFSVDPSDDKSCLYFKSSRELQSPVPVTICVVSDSEGVVDHLKNSITFTCQTIWTDTRSLLSCNLTFELTFHADYSRVDRLQQITSCMDFDRFMIRRHNLRLDRHQQIASGMDFDRLGRDWPNCAGAKKKMDRFQQIATLMDFDRLGRDRPNLKDEKCLNEEVSMECLFLNFSQMLETGLYHDVEIKCEGNSIMAHKLVLGTRSSVFRKMLQSDVLESQMKVIEIQDLDASYLQDFIRYLYTNQIPELTFDKAKALYKAGHIYDVQSLKLRCSEYLQENLSPENAFECYNLADAHSDQTLKDTVKTYLSKEKKKTPFLPVML